MSRLPTPRVERFASEAGRSVRLVEVGGDDDGDGGDERDLVVRASRDGDVEAFAELYRRYLPRVHAFAFRRTGSREVAEDISSATFERALRGLDGFRWRAGGFAPWLFRIAANELVDHHRRAGRAGSDRGRRAAMVLGPDPAPPVDELATGSDGNLVAAMSALSDRYQQALSLRFLSGLDQEAAARAMGISKPTMAVVVHRATKALRRAMDRLEQEVSA